VRALEREANVFAAELLMPEEAVKWHFVESPAASAAAFNVSEEAMGWRAYNLGLSVSAPR
jgi:Zn-dependent peptidase ImmA (M78 family)